LSNIEGPVLVTFVIGVFFFDVEENGFGSDQPLHAVGQTLANTATIMPAAKIREILTTMITTLWFDIEDKTNLHRANGPDAHEDWGGSMAKMLPCVQGNSEDRKPLKPPNLSRLLPRCEHKERTAAD
jgi:hypothetical protein